LSTSFIEFGYVVFFPIDSVASAPQINCPLLYFLIKGFDTFFTMEKPFSALVVLVEIAETIFEGTYDFRKIYVRKIIFTRKFQ